MSVPKHYPTYATKIENLRIDSALLLKEERRTKVSVYCNW